jgi:phosphatidylglycerophosphate synthase
MILCDFSLRRRSNPVLSPTVGYFDSLYCGICFMIYMMMDALDGRQARRTRSGSPMGQLFDHGCDSVLAGFLPVLVSNALGMGLGSLRLLTAATQFLFFVGMWEEKYTGRCRTTVFGLIGTSEYLSLFISLQFTSCYLPKADALITTGMIWFITGSAFLGSLICSVNVIRKSRSFRPLVDLIVMLSSSACFVLLIPQITSAEQIVSLSLVNSFMITLMVVSTMTKANLTGWMFGFGAFPLVAISIGCYLRPSLASHFLLYHAVGFTCFFLVFVVKLIHEIKVHLKIKVFSIKPSKQ